MRKLIGLVLTAIMTLTMVAGVSAADSGDANVCVQPLVGGGSIDVLIGDSQFGTVTYNSAAPVVSESDVVVTVTDTRGVVGGWNVTISGSNFATSPSTITFPSTALVLTNTATATTPATGSFSTVGGPVANTAGAPIITATNVGTSPAAGYVFNFAQSDLTVPAGTLVGQYKSTLTVTLTSDEPTNPCVPTQGSETPVGIIRNL